MTNQEFIHYFNQSSVKIDDDKDVRELSFIHRGFLIVTYYHTGDFYTMLKHNDPDSLMDGCTIDDKHTISVGNYFDDMIDKYLEQKQIELT